MKEENTSMVLQHFDNLELDTHLRILQRGEQPWFVAKDICDALELENTTRAISSLDDDELTLLKVSSGGQERSMNCVSESGLYALVFKSRKAEAKKFRKWVTGEVLPSIRRQGKYDPQALAAQMPPSVRRAFLVAQIEELEAEVIVLRSQADRACAIPGQMTVWQWLLLQGEEAKSHAIGNLSQRCKRLADLRGIRCGEVKTIDHAGQVTRLSRCARTYPEDILKEVCGQSA